MLEEILNAVAEVGKFLFEFFRWDTMFGGGWTLESLTGWYARRKQERIGENDADAQSL